MSGRPLRVAIFTESYLPYLSGVTVSTETLARGLGEIGHEVLVVAPAPGSDLLPGTAGAPGPEPAYVWLPSYQPPPPAPPGYRMPWPLPSAALRRAREFAPDVVHAQSPFVTGLMARRAAQQLRIPLLFTHHTRFADYRHYLGPLGVPASAALRGYLRDFWAGCAAIVAPGSELAGEIRAELAGRPRPVLRVIPTGVDVDGIAALEPIDLRAAYGWPNDAVIVTSVGRLAREKSADLLLDAFAVAAPADGRLRLLLVGGGPAEDELRRRVERADLAGRVALTGRLPREAALAHARGADLFLFASRTETQGLVLAEALAAGLPVVARQGPGVADAVRDGVEGIIVAATSAAEDARGLGQAVVGLAANPDRLAAMAASASEGARRFDRQGRVAAVAGLYEEVLTGRTTDA